MKVYLNGSQYELSAGTGVQRSPLVEWPQSTRLDGQQKRKDRTHLSTWSIDKWDGGLGLNRIDVNDSSKIYRLWDAENVDTRWSKIVLSPELTTCTVNPSRADLSLAFQFLDQLYFVETERSGTHSQPLSYAYKYTSPNTIGSFKSLAAGVGTLTGSLNAVREFNGAIVFTANSTSSGTSSLHLYVIAGTLNNLSVGTRSGVGAIGVGNANGRFTQLADMGGTLHILSYLDGRAYFAIADGNLNVLTGSVNNVKNVSAGIGTQMAPLVGDGTTMYAQLPEGVYNFDTTPGIIIDTSRAKDKNCMQELFNNDLYFKSKTALKRYDGTDVTDVGYNLEDGLPSDKWGEITAMTSGGQFLFAAVKGGTYSHILTKDTAGVWQYYARVPTAGVWVREMFLSDAPDGVDKLWCLFGSYGYPGYFKNPLTDPLLAGTYSFVPTGHFTTPVYDGGIPEEPGAFYRLSTSINQVAGYNSLTAIYGLNGWPASTSLGVATTPSSPLGTLYAMTFGSPYGVEGNKVQLTFLMAGSVRARTPEFESSILHYLKDPNKRYTYDFQIDIDKTLRGWDSAEALIGSMNHEVNSKVLMPFHYGQIGTKHVKVVDAPGLENLAIDRVYDGERLGTVRMRLAEIL